MTAAAAEKLLIRLCAIPELTPNFGNIYEPIDVPFSLDNLSEVIHGAMVPSSKARKHFSRTLVFFLRKTKPSWWGSIDLLLAPVEWTTPHNVISIKLNEEWLGGTQKLARYMSGAVLPKFPDYAKVVDSSQEDPDRLNEFRRPQSPDELIRSLANRRITAPMGPYGCLEDIY